MDIKVSVIVPVYNVENCLRKCLDSIINQTLKDIEIIVVNDGSTDKSLAICEEYAEKDNRITFISKENRGPSHTRNTGLKTAKGEYISFVDSDDYIEKNMLEKLYNLGRESSADIIFCNHDIISFNNFKGKPYPYPTGKTVYASEFAKDTDYFLGGNIMTVWGKIYRRDFLSENNIFFNDNIRLYEDFPFTSLCMEKAECICGTDEVLYHYVLRDNSLSNTYFFKYLDIFCNLNKEILENYENMSHKEFEIYIFRYLCGNKKLPYRKMTRKEKINVIRIVRESDFVNKQFFNHSAKDINKKNIFTFYFLKAGIWYVLFKYKCYNILSYMIK